MNMRIITILILSFLVGVFAHSLFPNFVFSQLHFFSLFAPLVLFIFPLKKTLRIFLMVYIFAALGVLRFSLSQETPTISFSEKIQSNKIESFHGYIVSEPDVSEKSSSFIFEADEFKFTGEHILVRTNSFQKLELGAYVSVDADLQEIENFQSESGRVFDYVHFLKKDSVHGIMPFAKVDIVGPGKDNFRISLFRLKHRMLERVYERLPRDHAALVAGVLFGEKSALSPEKEEQFRKAGLMHIVVLSGYNVALVIGIVMFIFSFMSPKWRAPLVVFSIVSFALLTGAGTTVLRASLMALFIVLAQVLDRKYHVERALLLAGFFMVLWDPWILYFDISFQLSFLASYGLIVLAPVVEKKLSFLPNFLSIRDSAVATISAQILVIPLILYSIGEFSLVSVFVNIIILFSVPFVMLGGFLIASFSLLSFPEFVISLLSDITKIIIDFEFMVVEFFAELAFATFVIPQFSIFVLVIIYAVLFRYLYTLQVKQGSK